MTAVEALIYCLGDPNHHTEDGDRCSRCVYDRHGEPHWIAWRVMQGANARARTCSETLNDFCELLEPYSAEKSLATLTEKGKQ